MKLAILNGSVAFPRGRRHAGCEYSDEFCDLITWMLSVNPVVRPQCTEVMKRVQGLLTGR